MSDSIAVLGAGSWGTALAIHCARVGHDVRLWGRDAALMTSIADTRRNARYLPEATIGDAVLATSSFEAALDGEPIVIAAVPSHGMRRVLEEARPFLSPGRGHRQRDQGARDDVAGPHVTGDCRRTAGASDRGVVGTELCRRGRARHADRGRRRVRRSHRRRRGCRTASRGRRCVSTAATM